MLQKISKCWDNFCIVAAPGPSLDAATAEKCRGFHVVAVGDAYRLFPFAHVLYHCDAAWWNYHLGVPGFAGEKWSSHGNPAHDNKEIAALRHQLRLVRGRDAAGFSYDDRVVHYGDNSGFQAINVAGHKIGWRGTIALVGFDMRAVDGKRHFFGNHPDCLTQTGTGFQKWPAKFARAAGSLPSKVKIINCTPESALTCFPMDKLENVLPI